MHIPMFYHRRAPAPHRLSTWPWGLFEHKSWVSTTRWFELIRIWKSISTMLVHTKYIFRKANGMWMTRSCFWKVYISCVLSKKDSFDNKSLLILIGDPSRALGEIGIGLFCRTIDGEAHDDVDGGDDNDEDHYHYALPQAIWNSRYS